MIRLPCVFGFYTAQNEVTLTGTRQDLKPLEYVLMAEKSWDYIALDNPEEMFEPYCGFLKGIQVLNVEGPVQIERIEDFLIISGATQQRRVLTDQLLRFADQADYGLDFAERHQTLRYYPGHSFLAPTSLTLVISVISLMSIYS